MVVFTTCLGTCRVLSLCFLYLHITRTVSLSQPVSALEHHHAAINQREHQRRPATLLQGGIPKLIHQSWKTEELPNRFSAWVHTWRHHNPDFAWYLWTDHTNRELVRRYYSWFLRTFDALQANISRADAARLLYMHKYGGVYTDLDNEALKPMTDLLGNMSGAVLGRMGSSEKFEHSLPNAWLASTPGHPFWLFALMYGLQIDQNAVVSVLRVLQTVQQRWIREPTANPEVLTGPVMLFHAYQSWQQLHLAVQPQFHNTPVHVLEPRLIYPLNWADDHVPQYCDVYQDDFNSSRCGAQFPDAYTIAYCASSCLQSLR